MQIISITPSRYLKMKNSLIRFSRKYGDQRITHKALRWLRDLPLNEFPEGTFLAVAICEQTLAGFILFGRYGLDEAFVVVHPDFRKQNIGENLLDHALNQLGKVYTRVACDNIPSLKLCFSQGLRAFHLFKGPTGKPTLCLGGGNWNPHEFLNAL